MTLSSPVTLTWTWKVQQAYDRADTAILEAIESQQGTSSQEIPHLSRSQLKRLIEEGLVTVNGTPLKANSKLKKEGLVRIEFPPPEPTELIAEDKPIDVLFEDEYLLVVNKPPELTVHPSATQMQGTLVHALLHHIQDLSGIGGVLRPGIVHRIDKNTSGALVITKTDEAHHKLSDVFSRHEIERSYWALCYGSPNTPNSTASKSPLTKIESLIARSPTDRKKMSMKVTEGKKAISYFRKQREFSQAQKNPFASWLEVTLETGRTHQVRVHLTGIGHSILGDPVYGTPTQSQPKWLALPREVRAVVQELPGQALHARVLGFQHPITLEKLRFEAEPPAGFMKVLNALNHYA